jgi:hypothetical protein
MTDAEKIRTIEEVLRRYRGRMRSLELDTDAKMRQIFRKIKERRLEEIRAKIKAHAK